MKVKVGVAFNDSTYPYVYYTNIELKHGDYVLVDSANRLGLAKVIHTNIERFNMELNRKPCTAWVLQKVDVESLRNNLKCELKEEGEEY